MKKQVRKNIVVGADLKISKVVHIEYSSGANEYAYLVVIENKDKTDREFCTVTIDKEGFVHTSNLPGGCWLTAERVNALGVFMARLAKGER